MRPDEPARPKPFARTQLQWPRPLNVKEWTGDAESFEMPDQQKALDLMDPSDPEKRVAGLWFFASCAAGSILLAAFVLIMLGPTVWEEGVFLSLMLGVTGFFCAANAYLFSRPFRRYNTRAARHFFWAQRLLFILLMGSVAALDLSEYLSVSPGLQVWGFSALKLVSLAFGAYYLWAYLARLREWFGPEEFLARELPKVDR